MIVRHVVGWEIFDLALKVGVKFADPRSARTRTALRAYRDAFVDGIRDYNARGVMARTWTCSSSSAAARGTCSTTPGRWRTAT